MPMTAGGSSVGVLGVPESCGPFDEARQGILSAAATLLGVAIRNAQLFGELRETSLRDGLTGCFNRTHALEVIDMELRRARRSQMPVSLIMFDLDHFKDINDRYGHLCGDAVLAAVGARMREVLRGSDLKCRYGGEEFLVLLPETALEGAQRVADTLRRQLADMAVQWRGETPPRHGQLRRHDGAAVRDRYAGAHRPRRWRDVSRQGSGTELRAPVTPRWRLSNGRAYLAWAVLCLVWGTTYLAIRVAIESIPPLLMAGVRWIVAGTLLIAFFRMRGERLPAGTSGRRSPCAACCSSALATGPSSGPSRPCRAA